MARKLKVYRTPIGFHDAYVAASSQKAALAAWGSSANLFARGAAEEVTDPALTAEPLTRPGTVVRKARGTAAEHLAALPPSRPASRHRGAAATPRERQAESKPPPKPRPSRAELDAAEAAIEAESQADAEARRVMAVEQSDLDRRRREQERQHARRVAALDRKREAAEIAYRAAMTAWRGDH